MTLFIPHAFPNTKSKGGEFTFCLPVIRPPWWEGHRIYHKVYESYDPVTGAAHGIGGPTCQLCEPSGGFGEDFTPDEDAEPDTFTWPGKAAGEHDPRYNPPCLPFEVVTLACNQGGVSVAVNSRIISIDVWPRPSKEDYDQDEIEEARWIITAELLW